MNGSVALIGAFVAAVFAMLAAIAWLTQPIVGGRDDLLVGTLLLLLAVASVGAAAFVGARFVLDAQLAPLRRIALRLRHATLRPRDKIAYLRADLPAPDGLPDEIAAVSGALDGFVTGVEQRHARQTAWIVAVVHDVKTPIAGAANMLGVLARTPRLADSAEGAVVERLAGDLRGIARDVQRLVDAVRFEREDVEIDREPLDLAAIASAAAANLAPTDGSVTVRVHGEGGADGDRALIARGIENLVGNAVRHARARVEIEVRPGLVRVSDDGPGLAAPLEVLAQPFRSEPRTVAGVVTQGGAGGIGLFLTRRVLELHGGRLVVERTDAHGTVLLAYVGRRPDG